MSISLGIPSLPQRQLTTLKRSQGVRKAGQHVAVRVHMEGIEHATNIINNIDVHSQMVSHIVANPVAELADGPLDTAADLFEGILKGIENLLSDVGVPEAYGWSIILLTLGVKAATYGLTRQQVESQIKTQAIQPQIKALQAKYQDNPEALQLKTSELYKASNVNPLAGCLPLLITLPVFIGLYRSITRAASEGLLSEGFFFIPSLGGPVGMNANGGGGGLSWLFPFVDGQPLVGWEAAGRYLILPAMLVVTQYISGKILAGTQKQPEGMSDEQMKQQELTKSITQNFLPLFLGYFSLNVPSALTLYWVVNNIVTTTQQLLIRREIDAKEAEEERIKAASVPVEAPGSGNAGFAAKKLSEQAQYLEDQRKERSRKAYAKSGRGEKFNKRRAAERGTTPAAASASSAPSKGDKFNERKQSESEPTPATPVAAEVVSTPTAPPPPPAQNAEIVEKPAAAPAPAVAAQSDTPAPGNGNSTSAADEPASKSGLEAAATSKEPTSSA